MRFTEKLAKERIEAAVLSAANKIAIDKDLCGSRTWDFERLTAHIASIIRESINEC